MSRGFNQDGVLRQDIKFHQAATVIILDPCYAKRMKKAVLALSTALFLSACYTPPDTTPAPDVSGNYVLDPAHAAVVWSLSHVGLSNYIARFDDISGVLQFDIEEPTASVVDIYVAADSVNTGLPDFDRVIATSGNGFDSGNNREIRFTSTNIQVTGDHSGRVTGDLTLRGETHPVTLDVTFNGAGKSFGKPGNTLGFSATGKIDRTQWGVTKWTNFGIGKVVTLRIEAEFNEKS